MTDVFVASDNIFSPLGSTTAENFSRLRNGAAGVRQHQRAAIFDEPFYASLFDHGQPIHDGPYTTFEQLLLASIGDAIQRGDIDPADKKTILIISSTKGNISLLESGSRESASISLPASARRIAAHFHFVHTPIVLSNACISGVLALLLAKRLLQSGQYENAVVAGADVISRFVLSGFGSFQAISPGPCKPFDATRDGINLGEGAGTIILSTRDIYRDGIRLRGGSVSNDANHISGPSRTGEELYQAITRSLREAGLTPENIDFVSAHGTATLYNDEMEAKALTRADLQSVPVNSLKGYYGHTLGAAGLIESIVTLQSMRDNVVLPSKGYEQNGVTKPLNVCSSLLHTPLNTTLKTASGFGGCNAAVVWSKY
jgi:3-oxoacyl-[acyl-carrier-protein] synthase-1